MLTEPTWFAEHRLTWVLPSGERKPGRIAIGLPEVVRAPDGEHNYQCRYVVEPFSPVRGFGRADDTMQALSHVMTILGTELYVLLAHKGVRAVYDPDDDPEDGALNLLMLLGPLIRDAGNPRGVADPEGKLAEFEAPIREGRRR